MTIRTKIEELAQRKLLGKRIDAVGFVDELLTLASREGEIRCTFANNEALRFTISDPPLDFEVPVDRARAKLRMMCARLAKLCQENGQEFLLYGGEGIIKKNPLTRCDAEVQAVPPSLDGGADVFPPGNRLAVGAATGVSQASGVVTHPDQWKVRFKNTMSEHEFIIQPA